MARAETMANGDSSSLRRRFFTVGFVAVIGFAYAGSLRVPFLFDDAGAVVNNPTIRHLWSPDVLRPPADGSTTTGRPLVNLSFAINHALSDEHVWSYHAFNLLIHLLAALVLKGIVRRTLAGPTLRARFGPQADSLGWLIALLWALHPLQTESVVCIAQRTESLCGLFYLLVLYAFVRATQPIESERTDSRRGWFTVSVVSCLLGMATKELMVTAPLIVMLYDRTFLNGSFAQALSRRSGYYAALAGTWLLLVTLVAKTGGARGASAGFGLGVTGWTYLLKQCEAIVLYLKLTLWPHPLVLDYGNAVTTSVADVWWQGLIVLTLIGATLWAIVKRPVLGFAGAWFFVILAPSSSVVPLVTQTIAEHRMYLPLAAVVAIGAIWLCERLGPRAGWPLIMACLVMTGVTRARVAVYVDPLAIWTDSVAHYPTSARAHNNLALVLQQRGRSADANTHFARAVELQPGYVWGHYNWGVALLEQERFSEASEQLDAAAHLAPDIQREARFSETQFQLGRLAERLGRAAAAELKYSEVLRLAPDHAGAHVRLGLLLARSQRLEPAAEHFRAAIRLRPDDADAHANLGNVLLLLSRPREALASYEAALRLRPSDARLQESIELARQALR